MSFNLKKYLVENNLTLISRKRETLKEEEVEPTQSDLAGTEKQFADSSRDKIIKFSQSVIKPLLNQYKKGKISSTDYKAQLAKASKDILDMDINSVFEKLRSYKKVDAPKEQD